MKQKFSIKNKIGLSVHNFEQLITICLFGLRSLQKFISDSIHSIDNSRLINRQYFFLKKKIASNAS